MEKSSIVSIIIAIAFTISTVAFVVVRSSKAVEFDTNCTQYIQRAISTNDVETAKKELKTAIEYAENEGLTEGTVSIVMKQPMNDVGFWYYNLKSCYEQLDNLPEDASELEKSNVLMLMKESLTHTGSKGTMFINMPDGITVYPENKRYFWWGIISFVGMFTAWIICGFILDYNCDI